MARLAVKHIVIKLNKRLNVDLQNTRKPQIEPRWARPQTSMPKHIYSIRVSVIPYSVIPRLYSFE